LLVDSDLLQSLSGASYPLWWVFGLDLSCYSKWTGLSVEESVRMAEDRDKWRKYIHGVANFGSRMAKEQNSKCSRLPNDTYELLQRC